MLRYTSREAASAYRQRDALPITLRNPAAFCRNSDFASKTVCSADTVPCNLKLTVNNRAPTRAYRCLDPSAE
jgi:hypothetical protein